MKKLTALFGVLLLSATMLVGCVDNTSPGEPSTEGLSPVVDEVPSEEPTLEEPTLEEPALDEAPVDDVVTY